MTFYERLKALMKETGTTQKQLSELGINKNSFNYWKTKGNVPKGDILSKLATYFDVSVPYLLGYTDEKKGAVPTELPLTPSQNECLNLILSLSDSELDLTRRFLSALHDSKSEEKPDNE